MTDDLPQASDVGVSIRRRELGEVKLWLTLSPDVMSALAQGQGQVQLTSDDRILTLDENDESLGEVTEVYINLR